MTAIVGVTHRGKVYIGGDSAGGAGSFAAVRSDPKVWTTGEYVFGFTDSFRMGQLLRYSLSVPTPKVGQDLFSFMVCDFVEAVRTLLKEGGYATQDESADFGGTFMVGTQGRLFCIEADFQVGEWADGFYAIGSGDKVALGALFASDRMEPRKRITKALEAAAHFGAYVRPPYTIEETTT